MGKEFKDIDFGETAVAKEYAEDFSSDRDNNSSADVCHTYKIDEDFEIPQEHLARLKKKYPQLFDGSQKPSHPNTRDEWKAYNAEFEKELEQGEFYPIENLFVQQKEDFPWLYD